MGPSWPLSPRPRLTPRPPPPTTVTTWARGPLMPRLNPRPRPPSDTTPDSMVILMAITPILMPSVDITVTPSPEPIASNTSQSTEPPMVSLKFTKDQLTLNPRLMPRPPPPTTVITAVDTVTDTDSDTEDTTAVDIMVIPDTVTDMVVTTVNLKYYNGFNQLNGEDKP